MAFLILFLFALLYVAARPAFTIQCRTCTGVNIECTGTLTTCSSEYDTCHLIFTEATLCKYEELKITHIHELVARCSVWASEGRRKPLIVAC
uniref:Uncharacterized protein n=1 Tax=Sphaerodactylus townsendi TaxID=933632 RepID=A0ACB8FRU3_9SAUR